MIVKTKFFQNYYINSDNNDLIEEIASTIDMNYFKDETATGTLTRWVLYKGDNKNQGIGIGYTTNTSSLYCYAYVNSTFYDLPHVLNASILTLNYVIGKNGVAFCFNNSSSTTFTSWFAWSKAKDLKTNEELYMYSYNNTDKKDTLGYVGNFVSKDTTSIFSLDSKNISYSPNMIMGIPYINTTEAVIADGLELAVVYPYIANLNKEIKINNKRYFMFGSSIAGNNKYLLELAES
jgi:hypothetical protein